jgi:hypothetical protein
MVANSWPLFDGRARWHGSGSCPARRRPWGLFREHVFFASHGRGIVAPGGGTLSRLRLWLSRRTGMPSPSLGDDLSLEGEGRSGVRNRFLAAAWFGAVSQACFLRCVRPGDGCGWGSRRGRGEAFGVRRRSRCASGDLAAFDGGENPSRRREPRRRSTRGPVCLCVIAPSFTPPGFPTFGRDPKRRLGSPHSKGFASWVTEKDVRPAGMVPGVAECGAMLPGCCGSMFSSLRMAGGSLRLGEHPHPR